MARRDIQSKRTKMDMSDLIGGGGVDWWRGRGWHAIGALAVALLMLWANQRGGSSLSFRIWLLISSGSITGNAKRWTAACLCLCLCLCLCIPLVVDGGCGGAPPKMVWRCVGGGKSSTGKETGRETRVFKATTQPDTTAEANQSPASRAAYAGEPLGASPCPLAALRRFVSCEARLGSNRAAKSRRKD
jgi:hypothetical protein